MFDCYNAMCPFRVNYTSNPNRCECTACPRRCTELTFSFSDTTTTARDTLTNDHSTLTGSDNTLTGEKRETGKWLTETHTYTDGKSVLLGYICPKCGKKDPESQNTCPGCGKDMRTAKEPPIGIMPEYIWKRKRYGALCSAIGRYVLAGMDPLPEWVEEGQRLLKEIETSEVRFSLSEPIGVCTGDPVGPKGPPGVCPRCGGSDISWEADSDVSRCNTCGWSDGRGEHGIP